MKCFEDLPGASPRVNTKKSLLTEVHLYNALNSNGYKLELISGKWFLNGKEFSLFGLNGIKDKLCTALPMYFGSEAISSKFIKWFVSTKNDVDGEWPELPIVTKAKAKIAEGYRPKGLAYPLNKKELKIIHYLINGDPEDTYAVFFYGVGGSGKSTICNLIASLFGNLDVSHCSFNSLTEKFARETLAGKRLWYDSDINANWSDRASNTFKKIITHDKDQFEKKGQDPYIAQYRCKCLFCCNVPPKFDLTDSGVLRRIIYYSKNEKIKNPNGNLVHKKYTEDELLDIAIAALLTDMTDWTNDFINETREIIMYTNNVAKYGMCENYETYLVACSSARALPYGIDKWQTLKEMFNSWRST